MPYKSKTPCCYPGCPETAKGRYCEKHTKKEQKRQDEQRGTSSQRGYGARWRKARKQYLQENPLCKRCEQKGKLVPATVVDHILPHLGDQDKFWDMENWQPLCKPCHDMKTAREDGGYGGKKIRNI